MFSNSELRFDRKEFWDSFYLKNEVIPLDWYFDLNMLKSELFDLEKFSKDAEILNIGVGLSNIIDILISKNFKYVTSIDFSEKVIQLIQKKYQNSDIPDYDFLVLDVKKINPPFPPSSIDLVIDKGCLDCFLTNPNGETDFLTALKAIYEVIKQDGSFYVISSAKPDKRINLFNKELNWKIQLEEIKISNLAGKKDHYKDFNDEDNIYYIYHLMKK